MSHSATAGNGAGQSNSGSQGTGTNGGSAPASGGVAGQSSEEILGGMLGDNSGGEGDGGNSGNSGSGGSGGSGSGDGKPSWYAGLPDEAKAEFDKRTGQHKELQRRARALEKERNEANQRLQTIDDANKTAEQKALDRAAKAEADARTANESRWQVLAAAANNLGPDMLEFLGGGSEEDINARAETLAEAVTREARRMLDGNNGSAGNNGLPGIGPDGQRLGGNGRVGRRPVESLRPGGTPQGQSGQQGSGDLFREMLERR